MLKSGLKIVKQSLSESASAHDLETIAYHNVKLAHTRSLEQPANIFAANAFHRAIDNYQRIVATHKQMGL